MNKRLVYLKDLVERGQADAFAHYAFAIELKKEGDLQQAALAFDQLRAAYPDYLPQYLIAGQMHLDSNQPEQAKQWLSLGLELAQKAGESKTAGEIEAALALC